MPTSILKSVPMERNDISGESMFLRIFYWLSMGGIICLALTLPLSESVKHISIGIAGLGFILYSINSGKRPNLYPVGIGFLLLLSAFVLTSLFAPIFDMQRHLKWVVNILNMGLVFIIIANLVTSHRERDIIIWSLLISLAVGEIWGVWNILDGRKHVLEIKSVGHSNHTGIYVATILTLNMSILYFFKGRILPKIILISFLILSICSLPLTGARGAIVGFIGFLLIFPFIIKNRKAILLNTFLIIGIGISGFFLGPLREKLLSSGRRLEVWSDALNIFWQSPIVGVGFNQYNHWADADLRFGHSHNLYLNILVQSGIIGFLSLLFILVGFMKMWLDAKRYIYDEKTKAYWVASLGAFTIVVISGITNTTLHSEHGIAFSILSGICASLIMGRKCGEAVERKQ